MGGFNQGGPEDPEVKIEDEFTKAVEPDMFTKAKEQDEFTKGKELDKFTKAKELLSSPRPRS